MDYLNESKTAWALNRIEFLHYNCGIPMSDIGKHTKIKPIRLRQFISHRNDGCNLTEKELEQVNAKLDTLFRTNSKLKG